MIFIPPLLPPLCGKVGDRGFQIPRPPLWTFPSRLVPAASAKRVREEDLEHMKRFTRIIEDFVCNTCGTRVTGNGYTNHCPKCLWSKHVDVAPGDRASLCGGAMAPMSVIVSSGGVYRIVHKCARCRFSRAQDAGKSDNIERLIELSASFSDKNSRSPSARDGRG